MKSIVLILFLILFLMTNPVFAVNQINKNIHIKSGYSYLLSFDEEVIRYKIGNNEAISVEELPNIYKDRHELVVRAQKSIDTNIIIWTKSNIYNFNIAINAFNSKDASITNNQLQNFTKNSSKLDAEIKPIMDDLELDNPPFIDKKDDYGFEVDKPPAIKK